MVRSSEVHLPLDRSERSAALNSLEQRLGAFGFRWLSACAALPVLRLAITLRLGRALKSSDGSTGPSEEETLALADMPWFRQGWIPDDWRVELLAAQSVSDREVTRIAISDLLFTVIDSKRADAVGRVTVVRVGSAPDGFAAELPSWIDGLPQQLHGASFAVGVPARSGNDSAQRDWRRVIKWVITAIAAGLALGVGLPHLLP